MRGALVPLQALAEKFGASVLMISHFNKGAADGLALSRVSGSGALGAVCRAAWMVERDPEDNKGEQRVFVPMKNNIGNDKYGFRFFLEGLEVENGIPTSRVRFLTGTVNISADDLVRPPTAQDEPTKPRSAAKDFLRERLRDCPQPANEIRAAAGDAGIHFRTLERAKKELYVNSRKIDGAWHWQLPSSSTKAAGDPVDTQGRQDRHSPVTGFDGGVEDTLEPTERMRTQDRQGSPSRHIGGLGGLGGLENAALADAFKG